MSPLVSSFVTLCVLHDHLFYFISLTVVYFVSFVLSVF
jgi:hypothetical protein